jgi:hypothetical protein
MAQATESHHQRYACSSRHQPSKKYLTTHSLLRIADPHKTAPTLIAFWE